MNISRRFSFRSRGLPADTFLVIGFSGTEAISKPYRFTIELVAPDKTHVDMEDLVHELSELVIHGKDGKTVGYQGVLARLEQLRAVGNHVFYRADLVPRLWTLGLHKNNRVFLDKSTPEILTTVLSESGLLVNLDVDLRLKRNYPPREYVCQFGESNLDFISRWMEREGMYYLFEQGNHGEKMVITDTMDVHVLPPGTPDLRYSQDSGLELPIRDELASSFICEQNLVPKTVMVKDYNYRKPTLDLRAESNVSENGLGKVYEYGGNLMTSEEANIQASLRAENRKVTQQRFKGTGTAPFLRPGLLFQLKGHFNSEFNSQYLTTDMEHHGDQSGYLLAGLGRIISGRADKSYYHNSFTAIPAHVQFRPERLTPEPRFYGTMSAVIDGEGSGEYAELDKQGRYKVSLPFDLADHPEGSASSWIRMAQPYGGSGHGMHFPLHKGTEVLLTFINGDPDQPVIASAVPNFEQPSLVGEKNAPASAIKSAGGNQLVMGDVKGQEFMGMWSPFHKSGIFVGSVEPGGGGSVTLSSDGKYEKFTAGSSCSATLGANNSFTMGVNNSMYIGFKNTISAAIESSWCLANKVSYTKGPSVSLGDSSSNLKTENSLMGLNEVTIGGGASGTLKGLIGQAKLALGLGVAGTAAAGAGIFALSAPFGDDFLANSKAEWKKTVSEVFGAIGLTAGAALTVAAAGGAMNVVDEYKKMQSRSKTTLMKLSKEGMDIKVNNDVSPNATFGLKVGGSLSELMRSEFTISSNGNKIELQNNQYATLTMENGSSIKLNMSSRAGDELSKAGLEITRQKVVLSKSKYCTINMEYNKLALKTQSSLSPTNSELTLKESSGELACGQNKVTVSSTGIKLNFEGLNLRAGPLAINPAGIVQLG